MPSAVLAPERLRASDAMSRQCSHSIPPCVTNAVMAIGQVAGTLESQPLAGELGCRIGYGLFVLGQTKGE